VGSVFGQAKPPQKMSKEEKEDFLYGLAALERMSATRPFLKDSSDVYLEPKSLNKFFTDRIYQRLAGNAYFGYKWDEGFTCNSDEIAIEEIKDLTGTAIAAYRLALESSLATDGYRINPKATCQIGLCIVGVEAKETDRTLPGVMVEAYLRNASTKKSFFMRYGAGSPRGLAAAMMLSAAMIVAELEGRNERPDNQ
jgi:hypothetical protein